MCKMQNESQLCWRRCVNERQKKRTVCSIKIYNVCCNVRCATQCIMQNETQLCWRRCVNEKQKKQTVCSIKSYRALHWMQCKMQCTTQCKMQNETWLCRRRCVNESQKKQTVCSASFSFPPPEVEWCHILSCNEVHYTLLFVIVIIVIVIVLAIVIVIWKKEQTVRSASFSFPPSEVKWCHIRCCNEVHYTLLFVSIMLSIVIVIFLAILY